MKEPGRESNVSTGRSNAGGHSVAVLGQLQDPSGAGLVHQQLAHHLTPGLPGLRLVHAEPLYDRVPSLLRRSMGRAGGADAVVWTSSPLPWRVVRGAALFVVVFDLRWLWTRGLAARAYRAADLARRLHRSRGVLTISETIAAQLALLTSKPVAVLPMGPGQFEGHAQPPPRNTKTIVLIGNATHKRNEEAARLLCASELVRETYSVVGVRISDECARILRAGLPEGCVTVHGIVPSLALAEILAGASTYLSLSTTEGFGFPYIEAAYFGSDVVAPDLPLTREVLGANAQLVGRVTPTADDLEAALLGWDLARVSALQAAAAARSWGPIGASAAEFITSLL